MRQAIAKVVDRQPMIESCVFGHGTAVATVFPPDFWAALDVQPEAPDIEGAKQLMATAGYADGFKTTMTSWSEYSFLSNAAIVLQEQLKQIGIEAEMVLLDAGTMIQTVYINKDFDMAVTGTSGYVDPHGVMVENFLTGSSGNFVGYSNSQVDDLIKQGQVETDTEKRADIYRQIQQVLIQDLPWVDFFVAESVRGAQEEYLRLRAHPDRFFDQTSPVILRRRVATGSAGAAYDIRPDHTVSLVSTPAAIGVETLHFPEIAMLQFILRRVLLLIPILFGVSVITFMLVRSLPGDPATVAIGVDQRITPEQRELVRKSYGLDDSKPVQYVKWMQHVVKGDLGKSLRTKRPLTTELKLRLPVTVELTLLAGLLGIIPALSVGVLAAVKRNSAADYVATVVTLLGISAPSFLVAILLILLFSYHLKWLPPVGYEKFTVDPIKNLKGMIMPAISLALPFAAVMMRNTRSAVLEVVNQDYVRVARAKGLSGSRVLTRHVLPNSALPIITIGGIQLAGCLAARSSSSRSSVCPAWAGTSMTRSAIAITRSCRA